jgi:hypothetical protein
MHATATDDVCVRQQGLVGREATRASAAQEAADEALARALQDELTTSGLGLGAAWAPEDERDAHEMLRLFSAIGGTGRGQAYGRLGIRDRPLRLVNHAPEGNDNSLLEQVSRQPSLPWIS